jgi:hypothetical protein
VIVIQSLLSIAPLIWGLLRSCGTYLRLIECWGTYLRLIKCCIAYWRVIKVLWHLFKAYLMLLHLKWCCGSSLVKRVKLTNKPFSGEVHHFESCWWIYCLFWDDFPLYYWQVLVPGLWPGWLKLGALRIFAFNSSHYHSSIYTLSFPFHPCNFWFFKLNLLITF